MLIYDANTINKKYKNLILEDMLASSDISFDNLLQKNNTLVNYNSLKETIYNTLYEMENRKYLPKISFCKIS
ncbi:hypothetical protein ACOTVP_11765 [Aliarcobacter butzleri]|uniref:hypothetical protein n=1 Tax=Aliarcobacter butzleri TaxID=28197 RepID=UPI0021B21521|nr:hypothetical protein [Aliarcobacter butzleri]UWY61403.1 hypothetical protein N3115_11030 [Aliarcobacter butzleri]UXC30702.1 hypothetical protein N3114_12410 [Aliarcobacter butzleri]